MLLLLVAPVAGQETRLDDNGKKWYRLPWPEESSFKVSKSTSGKSYHVQFDFQPSLRFYSVMGEPYTEMPHIPTWEWQDVNFVQIRVHRKGAEMPTLVDEGANCAEESPNYLSSDDTQNPHLVVLDTSSEKWQSSKMHAIFCNVDDEQTLRIRVRYIDPRPGSPFQYGEKSPTFKFKLPALPNDFAYSQLPRYVYKDEHLGGPIYIRG